MGKHKEKYRYNDSKEKRKHHDSDYDSCGENPHTSAECKKYLKHNKYTNSKYRKPNSEKQDINKKTCHDFINKKSVNLCSKNNDSKEQTSSHDDSDDLEEEIKFDWKDHIWELDKLFFADGDIIRKNTNTYKDFWKFLQKYHSLSKAKKIKEMACKNASKSEDESVSKVFELPKKFDKRYCINFALKGKDIQQLQDRLPPVDLEDKHIKRLSPKKLSEFKFIILLYLDFMQTKKFEKLKGIRVAQNNLPIAEYKTQILETVKKNTVTIIAGDTGCGKSTQIPQYLLSSGYVNIACTQPRRIACISLCKRVSYETLNEYGTSVGFQIRFEKSKTENTKIVFLTEGLLLRQVAADPMLNQYNVVILDEIHERHLQTDFLLGVIKCLNVQRPDLKIILMSATINIELFSNYFMGQAPVIQIPGRLYPIELKYFPISIVEKSSQSDKINPAPYVRILQLIDSSYPSDERGDLLVFLSGMREITTVMDAAKLYAQQTNKWVILPLHSTLSVSEQEKVFDIPPEGVRKCILSTNIAETSVTIDGVRFVMDSGKVKEMSYDPVHKMQKLKEFWISQASAEQRKGRAGRTGPGVCFRLFSEEEYTSFASYTTPEIMRVPLDSLILQMIAMGLPNIKLFPFIEPPSSDNLDSSLQTLKSHSALSPSEELTTIGQLLSQLPLDISLGKMLVMGSLFHQLGPVLSLAAAMSVQSPFTNRANRDPDCVALNQSLQSNHGDPFTLLMAYREWLYVKTSGEDSRRWCRKRGFEEQRFYEMTKLRQQFSQMLEESGLRSLGEDEKRATTSNERAKRYGELYQLKQMKRELHKQGPRKSQVLRVDHEGGVAEGDEDEKDVGLEIKDIDFKIRYDDTKLRELYKESKFESFKDIILLKIILCSGLYPNLAIGDEHNNYKSGSEQLFHTSSKPFVILHPNSVFSADPETLALTQADILISSKFSERFPCSYKHQLLAFVSLLETNKAYLVNAVRTPVAQTLLLFSQSIDTNVDISTLVFDNFIELKFADRVGAQNMLFKAVSVRAKWKELLEVRIKAMKPSFETPEKLSSLAHRLEKDLSAGLIELYLNEQYYSCKRLLAADVKLLHYGPGLSTTILTANPFSESYETCIENLQKGGAELTPYLTYNSLIDLDTTVTTITSYDSVCPFCDQDLHLNTLERFQHMRLCFNAKNGSKEQESDIADNDPNKKDFFCDICNGSFKFSLKDVLRHKKSHERQGS